MEDDILNQNDLDPIESPEEETPTESESTPDPQAEAQAQFEQMLIRTIESTLDKRGIKVPVESPKEEEPKHPGWTPEEIATSTIQASRLLRTAEREIRKEYNGTLTDDEIDEIMSTLEKQPYPQLVTAIEGKSHISVADMVVGRKFKSGQLKPPTKNRMAATPVGAAAPRSVEGRTSTETRFEQLYGKPKTKGQAERLKAGI